MGAEYKVHTKLLTEFETLGVMGENDSGIINMYMAPVPKELKQYCNIRYTTKTINNSVLCPVLSRNRLHLTK